MIGVDVNSGSPTLKYKARAEIELREIMPETIIMRPSDMYHAYGESRQDLFRRLASQLLDYAVVIYPEMLARRCRPVNSCDIGLAYAYALKDQQFLGKTFELGGRQEMSFEELLKFTARQTNLPMETWRMPYPMALAFGGAWEQISYGSRQFGSKDYLQRMQYDAVPAENDPNILGWEDLGIDERDLMLMEEHLPFALFNWTERGTAMDGVGSGMTNHSDTKYSW